VLKITGVAEHRRIDLQQTLQHVNVPAAIADWDGVVTWENGAAENIVGEIVGKPFWSVVAPEDAPTVERALERKREGEPMTDYEVDVITRDGERRPAQISTVTIDGGDRCHAIFGIALVGPVKRGGPVADLTPRQTEVLMLLGEGASTDQIAAMLHLSRETVRNHIRHILAALGVHSRLEAVVQAHRQGLFGDD
jgi:PAS domain S-box-containing protein